MTERLNARFDFQSPVIQAQTVRNLVAAVLKEKDGKITQSSNQGPALTGLWLRCHDDAALVRSLCCDAVVVMVTEGHLDLHYALNSALNLLPSASHVQELLKLIGRLLRLQVASTNQKSPYSIRVNPHPYITALENRPDCWAELLLEIDQSDASVGQSPDPCYASPDPCYASPDPCYASTLAPFLRYVYCQPRRNSQHALLRERLLRGLLARNAGATLSQLLPYMPAASVEAVLEVGVAIETVRSDDAAENVRLVVHSLTACKRCLQLDADFRHLVRVLEGLIPKCGQALPLDELIVGVAFLLLEAPPPQQNALLRLALTLVPESGSGSWSRSGSWSSPVLVLPILQLGSCSGLTTPFSDWTTNQEVALKLLPLVSSVAAATPPPPRPPPRGPAAHFLVPPGRRGNRRAPGRRPEPDGGV